jgi:ABC-type Na+ efflux pump permease subunit
LCYFRSCASVCEERSRGTLEQIVLAGVEPRQILWSKQLAILRPSLGLVAAASAVAWWSWGRRIHDHLDIRLLASCAGLAASSAAMIWAAVALGLLVSAHSTSIRRALLAGGLLCGSAALIPPFLSVFAPVLMPRIHRFVASATIGYQVSFYAAFASRHPYFDLTPYPLVWFAIAAVVARLSLSGAARRLSREFYPTRA